MLYRAITLICLIGGVILLGITVIDLSRVALGGDFHIFYTVARSLVEGTALAGVYDFERFGSLVTQHTPVDRISPFVYPPPFAFLLYPLGAVDIFTAFTVWGLSSLICAFIAMRLLGANIFLACVLTLNPVSMMVVMQGQVELLLLLPLLFGFRLNSTRPFICGLLWGLIFLKPQLAIFPLLMALSGFRWRILLGMALTGASLFGCSLWTYGLDAWLAFAEAGGEFARLVLHQPVIRASALSPQSLLVALGVDQSLATVAHWLAIFALSAWVFRWRSDSVTRLFGLTCVAMLAPPYMLTKGMVAFALPCIVAEQSGRRDVAATSLLLAALIPALLPPFYLITDLPLGGISVALALVWIAYRRIQTQGLKSCRVDQL